MSAFCPDCGKVIKANKCRCGWQANEKRVAACSCGAQTQIGYECWLCYGNRTGVKQDHDAMLNANLEAIGLGRRENESCSEYAERCRASIKIGGMGKAIGGGA